MQYLKLIFFAVLVAACVFHVGAFPAETSKNEQSQSGWYLGYAKSLASAGAGYLGSGLYAGAGLIGSGLYVGAGMVGDYASNYGAGTQFSLESLSRSLSNVNAQSLAASLGLPDLTKAITDKVDIYGTIQNVFVNQVMPAAGSINYQTASVLLEKLVLLVPSLKKTVDGFKTVLYVIQKIRTNQKEGKQYDATFLVKEAVDTYFKDVDPQFKQKLIDLSPTICDAALGNKDAVYKVASALADRNTLIEALKGMGYKAQIDLIRTAIGQVSDYATLIKATDAATHQTK